MLHSMLGTVIIPTISTPFNLTLPREKENTNQNITASVVQALQNLLLLSTIMPCIALLVPELSSARNPKEVPLQPAPSTQNRNRVCPHGVRTPIPTTV
jgi:hypothetical protein